jgi:tagatose 1,6-diphosphate aldolase
VALSPGKLKGLQALANERGIIAALALDQRSALRKLFAKATGQPAENVPADLLVEFKEHVSRVLTPYATAILLDPEYGLAAAAKRDKKTGLLLAYERSGYDNSVPGRLPQLLDGYSAARLKRVGANAVKVLLYYSPFSADAANSRKQTWVERVGAECLAEDVPFFLEIVGYHDEMDEKGPEFAKIKPEVVIRSVEEFCKSRYGVDVLKVGVPVNMNFVESVEMRPPHALYSREEAKALFRATSQASSLPFIYLSEGVSNEVFSEALSLAAEARSDFSGVLCGRAIWQDGVTAFAKGGPPALDDWLNKQGIRNITNVNAQLSAARPWFEKLSSASTGKG